MLKISYFGFDNSKLKLNYEPKTRVFNQKLEIRWLASLEPSKKFINCCILQNELSKQSASGMSFINESLNTSSAQKEASNACRAFDCDSFIVREFAEQKKREEELHQQRSRNVAITGFLNNAHFNSGTHEHSPIAGFEKLTEDFSARKSGASEGTKQSVQVLPYEDTDEEDVRYSFITPHEETVVEREVKLIRQRESSLRRVRGYPAPSKDKPVEIQLSGFEHRSSGISPHERQLKLSSEGAELNSEMEDVALKRLATNRLRMEILRERQREIDLRSQGKIYTISEERIGQPLLLVDVEEQDKDHSKAQLRDHRKQSASALATVHVEQAVDNKVTDKRQMHVLPAFTNQRSLGERLIEKEVQELKRREEELR